MRNSQQEADGIVGEVIFPNTVPPFFPSFVLFAGPPSPSTTSTASPAIRAHNRWLVDWCNEFPERAAPASARSSSTTSTTPSTTCTWIKEHGLRGGVLLPNIPPSATWMKPLYDPEYDRLWEVCQDLEVPDQHPRRHRRARLRPVPGRRCSSTSPRSPFYSQRPLVHMILSGVFERFPTPQVRADRAGLRVGAAAARAARPHDPRHPRHGRHRRDPLRQGPHPPEGRDRVLPPERVDGRQPAGPERRRRSRQDRRRAVHVGQRLPARRRHVAVHP